MRVEHERVSALGAIKNVAQLWNDCGGACVSGIDMEPEPLALAQFSDRRYGIDARRRGRADGGDHAEGQVAGSPIFLDSARERDGIHAELGVDGDLA